MEIERILPDEIEARSMEIIEAELDEKTKFPPDEKLIVKRVIHTTADFDYAANLRFSPDAVAFAISALKKGAAIITDTQMAKAGISKPAAAYCGCELHCFMSDEDVAASAKKNSTTRAIASMDKAAELFARKSVIFAIGNAPTALIRLFELISEK
ncbi:MAG: precorrin-8X methylmutase, partial [Oscillospiraceae bacterium]